MQQFFTALDKLGKTDEERAKKLAISKRQIQTWKSKGPPKLIQRLLRNPVLLQALIEDAKAV